MHKTIQQRSTTIMAAVASAILFAGVIASCTKPGGNPVTQFVGSWKGTTMCDTTSTAVTLMIAAGSGANTLTDSIHIGSSVCMKTVNATGSASGNGFNFPTATYTDLCGLSYTLGFAGVLSKDTLTVVETIAGTTTTCIFKGTK